MRHIAVLLLITSCSRSPAPRHVLRADSPIAVLHVLTAAEGLAVRGAPVELDRRLYFLAGEAGPNGTDRCNSGAMWQTVEHTAHCPGALLSIGIDGSGFRVDHAFSALDAGRNSDGYHPYGTLAVGLDGRLYGVAQMGGAPTMEPGEVGYGVLFAYGPPRPEVGDPGSFEVLHTFGSESRAMDGEYPMGALAVDDRGDVFGTSKGGGRLSSGTVWEWSPGGAFRFAALPGESYGGVALGRDGVLHGTTWSGGDSGVGSYFTVDSRTLEVIVVASLPAFTWNEHGTDNTPIQAPLVLGDGTVVVAREFGGAAGAGLVVRLDQRAGVRVIHDSADIPLSAEPRFSNHTGSMLNGQIAEGRDGMIYGTAQYGGSFGTGAIWRMARDGSMFRMLWSWPDAAYPYGGVIVGSDGALYGVTFNTSQIWRMQLPVD